MPVKRVRAAVSLIIIRSHAPRAAFGELAERSRTGPWARTRYFFVSHFLLSAQKGGEAAGDHELTPITVRIPKELRFALWKMKIFRRTSIEVFVREAIDEKLREMNP